MLFVPFLEVCQRIRRLQHGRLSDRSSLEKAEEAWWDLTRSGTPVSLRHHSPRDCDTGQSGRGPVSYLQPIRRHTSEPFSPADGAGPQSSVPLHVPSGPAIPREPGPASAAPSPPLAAPLGSTAPPTWTKSRPSSSEHRGTVPGKLLGVGGPQAPAALGGSEAEASEVGAVPGGLGSSMESPPSLLLVLVTGDYCSHPSQGDMSSALQGEAVGSLASLHPASLGWHQHILICFFLKGLESVITVLSSLTKTKYALNAGKPRGIQCSLLNYFSLFVFLNKCAC